MIDSGTEIIKFPHGGFLISAHLSEESNQILTKGLQFEEAFIDSKDLEIDSNEKFVPTIGIVDHLPGLEDTSGSIIVMTDSSCTDSASPSLSKCFWLLERFVRLASG